MSYSREIGELISALGSSGSLETALSNGVRLVCRATGCYAGAIVTGTGPVYGESYRYQHDPQRLLAARLSNPTICEAHPSEEHASVSSNHGPAFVVCEVRVSLHCEGTEVGCLALIAPRTVAPEQVKARLAAIPAALGVLLAAAEGTAAKPLSAVLNRQAFRARVIAELARAERGGEEFAVVHARISDAAGDESEATVNPWVEAARRGEALAGRLRRRDVVGLLGRDYLAVLLPATKRLGARIAARRVELILRRSDLDSETEQGSASGTVDCCLRLFPHDGSDVDGLCCAPATCSETNAPMVVSR